MWTKIVQWTAQFLLIPLLKDLFAWIKKEIEARLERKNRHKENQIKVSEYENSSEADSSDKFSNLP